MQKIVLSVIAFFITIAVSAQCISNVNFNTWAPAGYPANGQWSVQNGGSQVYQGRNGDQAFYVSPYDLMNVHISGTFRSNDTDDDWMGFVFSFLNPLTPIDTFDCWLFDWKQKAQNNAQRGMSVCRLNGYIPNSYPGISDHPQFWDHTPSPAFTVVANNWGSAGWSWLTNHDFDLYLTYSKATIYVDGTKQFEINDCFKPGRFGFYNLSQQDCIYSNFQYELFVDYWFPDQGACVGTPASFRFIDPCVTSLGQYQSLVWDFGDGQTQTINNPTLANVNVTHTYASPGTYTSRLTLTDLNGCSASATHAVDVRAPIVLTPTITRPLCNGASNGNISLAATGGFGNFNYTWSNNINGNPLLGVSAGTYTVTATDNRCVTTATFTVTQPTAVTATTSHTDATCNQADGTATIVISGGTPPYSGGGGGPVNWGSAPNMQSANATGLAPGTYVADFKDANGCSAALQYRETIIGLPCGIQSSTTVTNVLCKGRSTGGATLSVTGSTGTPVITWNPGGTTGSSISNKPAGTYTYTYSDANPSHAFSGSVTITEPLNPMTAQISTLPIDCPGSNSGQAVASVISGGTPNYTYNWTPPQGNNAVATNLAPGNYSVTITDANTCTATATGTVSGVASLNVTFTTIMDSCYLSNKGSAFSHVTGGSPPYTYAWSNFSVDTAITRVSAGTYRLTVTDFNGCSVTATTTITGPAAPLTRTVSKTQIACNGQSTGSITVSPTGGTGAYTFVWNPNTLSGPSNSNLAAGIYNYTVTDIYGCRATGADTLTEPATALTAVTSHTNVKCNGGSDGTLSINTSGGTPPYTFLGQPLPAGPITIPGRTAGVYAGNVTDANGCTFAVSETITEPAVLAVGLQSGNILCNGASTGNIDLTIGGGTTPYTFTWSDGPANTEDRSNIPAGTYSVTVTDLNLCTATATVTLTQPPALTISETHVNVLCNGQSTGSIDVTVGGGQGTYTYAWSDGPVTTQDRSNIAAGNYTVTATDQNSCTISVSATISQPAAFVVTTSHTDVKCNGGSDGTLTINVSGGTPPYTFLGNPVPAGTTVIPGRTAGIYAGNVTDANGCSVSVSETIAQPGPQSLTVNNTNEPCFGATVATASANFVNATGTVTYNWNPGNLSGANISSLAAGTYTVTATDQNLCSFTGTVTVTQPAAPVMNVAVTNALCFGANGSATANPSGGTAPYNYTWSGTAANTQTVALPAGAYTVTATDASTCQQTASFTITEPNGMSVVVQKTNVLCFGDATGAITLTVSGGAGPNYTYSWQPNVSTTNSASSLTAGTYNIRVTDQGNCNLDTAIVIAQPAAALSNNVVTTNVTCFGANDGTVTITTTGGTTNYSYTWNPNVATGNAATGLGPNTYLVTVTDANGCSLTETATVTEPTQITLTQTQTNVLCNGAATGDASIAVTGGSPGYTYSWTPNVSTGNTASALTAGNYSVIATDASSCTISATFTITQPPALTLTETHTDVDCFGNSTGTMNVTAGGGVPGYTYAWTNNVSSTSSATGLAAGNYTVTATDANSCTVSVSASLTEPAVLDVTATATDALCFGSTDGVITATATGGNSGYTYSINSQSSNAGLYPNMAAGTYTVYVTDAKACVDSTPVTVNEPTEIVLVTTPQDVQCYGYTNGQIAVLATGGATPSYTFALSNGNQNSTGIFTNLAVGFYTVTVTNANNCTVSDTASVNQPDSVTISVSPDPVTVNLGSELQLTTTNNQSGTVSYNWLPSFGLSCYDCADPKFTGNYSQIYTATVTNANGCSGTATVNVTVVPAYDIFIPNAFTPNGDGANDTWKIFGNLPGIKQIEVMVFNRIGEKVFQSNDINFEWDGYFKGVASPNGVYTYTAKFVWLNNHSDNDYRGTITLLR